MKQRLFWRTADKLIGVVVMITTLFVLAFSMKSSRETQPVGIVKWSEGWYYINEGGERVEVSLPATIRLETTAESAQADDSEDAAESAQADDSEDTAESVHAEISGDATESEKAEDSGLQESSRENGLILYHDTILAACAGQTILVRGSRYDMRFLADKEVLYDSTDHFYDRTEQMEAKSNCIFSVKDSGDERRAALTFSSTEEGVYEIGAVYSGSSEAIFLHCLRGDLLILIVLFLMLMLGLLSWLIYFYLKKQNMADARFVDMGAFLLLCGIWCGTDASLIQQLAGNSPMIYYCSYFSFMLLPIPLVRFVRHTMGQEKELLLAGFCGLFYVNFLLQTFLTIFMDVSLVRMLPATHGLMLAAVVGISLSLRKVWKTAQQEEQEDRLAEIRLINQAVSVLCGFAILALCLYWILEFQDYELLVEIGMLIFVGQILVGLVDAAVNGVGYKAEMRVYERLALEDRLTGMRNHRAFEEQMEEITLHAAEYENAMLIFMDLNRLKVVNDQYGHGAGDEMIVGAAICIERAFSEYGSCYRIGGDEFCAVIVNPTRTRAEMFRILEREISDYNVNATYRVSIAKGASFLRDENHRIRTVSDWKQDADKKMYADKKWQHKRLEEEKKREP